jgi:hypothetical protein
MTERAPTFTGYVPAESAIKFLDDFRLYCAIKLFTNVQALQVLGAVLRGPAKIAYDAALGGAIVLGGGGTPEGDATTTLGNALTWI